MDLRIDDDQLTQGSRGEPSAVDAPAIDLHRHIALFRRHLRLFIALAVSVFIAGAVVTFEMTPKYTAQAQVMLDPRQHNVSSVQEVLSGLPADTTAVDTEVEVLKSRNLAEKVIKSLALDKDPEFNVSLRRPSLLQSILPKTEERDDASATEERHNKVVDRVMASLKVARSGLTYVIATSFTSTNPQKAAVIANSFANNYLLEQLDAKFDATKRASDWLNSRLGGLKTQVEQAEAAVAQYKAAHGLLGLTSSEGSTIAQQEISTLNTQLAQAKAQQAEAEANLSTASHQLSRGSSGDDLGASLNSPVIEQLRAQRAQISSQVADMGGRLGPRHPDMLKAQRQLSDIDAQIQSEIKRIYSNLDAQAQVSRQRTASILGSLNNSRGSLAANGSASVQLNDLQRNADSLAALYQTYLERFKQTSNQSGFEQSDSRVVSFAKTPTKQSFPNIQLFLIADLAVGIAAALGAIFLVEALESGLYTSEDIEKMLNMPHIGSIPLVQSSVDNIGRKRGLISPTFFVVERPLSVFAEAFRNLRTSILSSRVGEAVQVVALTSALPGEGKTTTCICLARVIALGGSSTIVVDCDLRKRTVNRLFLEEPKVGLLEVLSGKTTLEDAIVVDDNSSAHFLPLSKSEYTPRDVFSSDSMDRLLQTLRQRYDVILLDTAPVLPVADTRVLAPKADVVVFLAQWRKTPRKAVEAAIKQLENVGALVVGIGLTQVDMREQARSGYGDPAYYYRSYKQYYAD